MSDPEFEVTDELASFIGDLHDSEINGEIFWFYDGVWGVKIGDRLNGYKAEATFPSFPQAMRWLRDKALELYPTANSPRIIAGRTRVTSRGRPRRARVGGPVSRSIA